MEQDLSNPSERNLTVNRQDIILYILRGNFTAGKAMSIFVKEKKCPLECPMSILLICPYQVSDCVWVKTHVCVSICQRQNLSAEIHERMVSKRKKNHVWILQHST